MKIILFAYKLARGGAEKMVSLFSLHLPNEIKPTILLLRNEVSYPYRGDIRLLETLKLKSSLFTRLKVFIQRYRSFKDILKEIRPDYVITYSWTPSLLATLLFPRTIVAIYSVVSLSSSNSFWHRLMWRSIYSRAYKIVVLSEGTKQDLKKNLGVKKDINVINGPVDIKNAHLLSMSKDLDNTFRQWKQENIPILITAGTLTEPKAQHHLLRAFAHLRGKIKCKLVILGSGERKDYLVRLSKELSIQNEVLFLGFQQNPYKYFANADIFVFSSIYEAFGLVIVEAMACGLPVISTSCYSGPCEILDPDVDINHQTKSIRYAKYGILVPTCDGVLYNGQEKLTSEEIIFSEAMLKLLQDNKMREKYSELAIDRSKDFDMSICLRRWLDVINN